MRRTVAPDLDSNMVETAFDVGANTVGELLQVASAGMGIAWHGEPAFTAQQFVDRHSRTFAFDVPERLVKPAQGIVQDWAVAPIGAGVSGLPQIFDVVGIASPAKGIQILVDRSFDRQRPLVER